MSHQINNLYVWGGIIDVEAVQVSRWLCRTSFSDKMQEHLPECIRFRSRYGVGRGRESSVMPSSHKHCPSVASRYVPETTMGCVYALIPLRQAAFMNQMTVQLYDFHLQLRRLRDASRELSLHQKRSKTERQRWRIL